MSPTAGRSPRRLRATHFVGRDGEIGHLDAALDRALRCEAPQLVTLLGPLGAGKSRLVDEWLGHLAARDHLRTVRVPGSPPSCGKPPPPFALIAGFLRQRFGIEGLDHEASLRAFRSELQVVFGDRRVAEVAAWLGHFLGFDLPESPLGQALALRPDQVADLTRAVFCRFLEQDAQQWPLVLAVEDLHLADDQSLDLLARLGSELAQVPIVFVFTARPELLVRRPEWGRGGDRHARVEIGPLGPLQVEVFISSALGSVSLPPGLAERAAVESGGNPLLLERLLGVYYEHGALAADTREGRWIEDSGGAVFGLGPEPAAQARIAALSPAERDLLARAAVFGALFWTGGVVALGRLGSDPIDVTKVFAPDPCIEEVGRMLDLLEERGYLARAGASSIPGETEWSFSWSAELTLLAAGVDAEVMRRRKRFAAQWIEARAKCAPGGTDGRLALVGSLYEEGGDPRRAGQSFIAVGDQARAARQLERARACYLRGVRHLDLDDSVLTIETYHKLGDVAARLGRSREAVAHFGEMLKVAWRLDLPAKGGAAHARIGRLHRTLGDYPRALRHLGLAHLLFELAGDRAGLAATIDDVGRVHFLSGNPVEAMCCHQQALALREDLGDEAGKALTFSWMGLVRAQGGDLAGAYLHFRRALALARAACDPRGIALALGDMGTLELAAGRPEVALAVLEEARRLAREAAERLCEARIELLQGECLRLVGRLLEAERELTAAKAIARGFGARRLVAEADRALAELCLESGDTISARDHAHAALAVAKSMGTAPLAGASLRVLATAVARGAPGDSDRGGARELFDRAVETLEGAGSLLELARTLFAYAEFEDSVGREKVAFGLRAEAAAIRSRAMPGADNAVSTGAAETAEQQAAHGL